MVYIFLADGFEESEALLPADILKRAGLDVCLGSITADKLVASRLWQMLSLQRLI